MSKCRIVRARTLRHAVNLPWRTPRLERFNILKSVSICKPLQDRSSARQFNPCVDVSTAIRPGGHGQILAIIVGGGVARLNLPVWLVVSVRNLLTAGWTRYDLCDLSGGARLEC